MTKKTDRVMKADFLDAVARRAGVPLRGVETVYEAFVAELLEMARSGRRVLLTGFGDFYPQIHKGHSVQFASRGRIGPYPVLKFSARREVNRSLEQPADPGAQAQQADTEG